MLTKEQIKIWSKRDNIGLGIVERDYIQQIFLCLLYSRSRDFVFKGGTCLKFAHKLNRYSEDLDFNYNFSLDEGLNILEDISKRMETYGVLAEVRNKKGRENQGFGFDLSYKGPLYDGRDVTKGKIRIDVSLRKEKLRTESIIIVPRYDDVAQYTAVCASLQDLFAEKIRALLIRGKPRDLYDVWFLLTQGIRFDENLINEKLKLYNLKFEKKHFIEEVNKEKKVWRQELESLLPQVPSFEEVREKILDMIK